VFDFGCGVAHSGLAFAAAGYRTVCVDVMREHLDFQQFMADVRGLEPVLIKAETEEDFYDTGSDGHEYGLVIEWSSFEHVRDARSAVEALTAGLVPGGYFVTTTFCKDWTPELLEHYRRDSYEDEIFEEYLSPELDQWLRERFDVCRREHDRQGASQEGLGAQRTVPQHPGLVAESSVEGLGCGCRPLLDFQIGRPHLTE
jgi:SAM-dependent methyltransferase